MPFHDRGAQTDRDDGRDQPDLMAGITDRAVEFGGERFDHAEVQFLRVAGVGAGRVGDRQTVYVKMSDRGPDLFHRGHARGKDDRTAGGVQFVDQCGVREGSRGYFIGDRIELFHKVDRFLVPDRCEPVDIELFAEIVDPGIFFLPEFDVFAVFKISDVTPGGLAHF